MEASAIKLEIIDRLMKINSPSALQKLEELITQAEMESRTEESLDAIKKGHVLTPDAFRKENQAWVKQHTK